MNIKKIVAPAVLASMLLAATPGYAHTVKSGDTMGKIANDYAIPLNELAGMNPQVSDIDLIYVGQNIDTVGKARIAYKAEPVATPAASNEVSLLARLVEAEAGNESYTGKVAVAQVVLNRVDSSSFPDSISQVIYQPGQFSPVSNGMINKAAKADSVKAAQEAINNRVNDGSLYFYNPATATSRWLDGLSTVKVIGNHVFKK